jgi:hypothetical protein
VFVKPALGTSKNAADICCQMALFGERVVVVFVDVRVWAAVANAGTAAVTNAVVAS